MWDSLALGQSQSVFLQSWEWGEFQKKAGREIRRYGLFDEAGSIAAAAQCVRLRLPFGLSYWLVPRGPIVKDPLSQPNSLALLQELLEKLRSQCNGTHLRIEPPYERCYESLCLVLKQELGLRRAGFVHPENSRIIDLQKSEDELLSAMHPKTRYNIRLAEKKGVTVESGAHLIEEFLHLNKETTERDQFISHSDAYYRAMVTSLPEEMLTLYGARFQGRIIAANIVVTFGNTTTYLHGASSSRDRSVMAPHVLQWSQIQDAKKRGSGWYDFWGVAAQESSERMKKHWAGITRFKNGFPGREISYLGTFDLPISNFFYSLYRIARKLRNI